jgi:glycoprotein-N-acetylgalactosamine 3-beta-galactosyltransferase
LQCTRTQTYDGTTDDGQKNSEIAFVELLRFALSSLLDRPWWVVGALQESTSKRLKDGNMRVRLCPPARNRSCGRRVKRARVVSRLLVALALGLALSIIFFNPTSWIEKNPAQPVTDTLASNMPPISVNPLLSSHDKFVATSQSRMQAKVPSNSTNAMYSSGDLSTAALNNPPKRQTVITKNSRKDQDPLWKNCSVHIDGMDLLKVAKLNATSQNKSGKILCFLLTHSKSHRKVKAVLHTWGKRCDKWVVASDLAVPDLHAVQMKSAPTYQNLWNKLNETLHYIYENYFGFPPGHENHYDWFFKVDDDTFVVMENLRAFLASPQVQDASSPKDEEPLIYGRHFAWPPLYALRDFEPFFHPSNTINADFSERFYKHFSYHLGRRLIYPSGGAGYVMNRHYLEKLVQTLTSNDTLRGIPDEDMALAINMMYHGIGVQSTRDAHGKERFHPESPSRMYNLPATNASKIYDWLVDNHKEIGGIQFGNDCCSPYSISFHHVPPMIQRYMNYKLYSCPK